MSYYYYASPRLAGLDAMVLHISNQHHPEAVEVDAQRALKVKARRFRLHARLRRAPFSDKTSETNIPYSRHVRSSRPSSVTSSVHSQARDACVASRRSSLARSASQKHSRAPSSVSTLKQSERLYTVGESPPQLPAFLDFLESPISSAGPLSPPLSPISLFSEGSWLSQVVSTEEGGRMSPRMHEEPYLIPAFQHPNSPYVPWDPRVRRRVLRPRTPSSCFTLQFSVESGRFDRSGAAAPEPAEEPPKRSIPSRILTEVASRFRAVKRAVGRKIGTAAKCVSKATPRLSKRASAPIQDPQTAWPTGAQSLPRSPLHRISEGGEGSPNSTAFNPFDRRHTRSPSLMSMRSSGSSALREWLELRRRASLEGASASRASIALAEFERSGSWLHLCTHHQMQANASSPCLAVQPMDSNPVQAHCSHELPPTTTGESVLEDVPFTSSDTQEAQVSAVAGARFLSEISQKVLLPGTCNASEYSSLFIYTPDIHLPVVTACYSSQI